VTWYWGIVIALAWGAMAVFAAVLWSMAFGRKSPPLTDRQVDRLWEMLRDRDR
jgi:hypothetical protein